MHDTVVQEYIERICKHVKVKEYHSAIKSELLNFIDDNMNALVSQGEKKSEAVRLTLTNLGDPDDLGLQFKEAYKPEYNISQICIFLLFIVFFFLAECCVVLKLEENYIYILDKLVIIFLGILSAGLLFVVSWSYENRIYKFSLYAFISVIVLGFSLYFGNFFNNYIAKEIMLLAPLISCCLMARLKDKATGGFFIAALLFLIPVVIAYKIQLFSSMIILATSAWMILVIMLKDEWMRIKRKRFFIGFATCLLLGLFLYLVDRKSANVIMNIEVFFVQNFFRGDIGSNSLELFDYPLTLMIVNYGFPFLVIYMFFCIFMMQSIINTYKKQRNLIAKIIIVSVFLDFMIEFIFSILLNMGIPLIKGFSVPFLAFDFGFVIKMIQIGIIKKIDCYGNYIFSDYPSCKLFDIENGKIIIYYR